MVPLSYLKYRAIKGFYHFCMIRMRLWPLTIIKIKLVVKNITIEQILQIYPFVEKYFKVLFKKVKMNVTILILYNVFYNLIERLNLVIF